MWPERHRVWVEMRRYAVWPERLGVDISRYAVWPERHEVGGGISRYVAWHERNRAWMGGYCVQGLAFVNNLGRWL